MTDIMCERDYPHTEPGKHRRTTGVHVIRFAYDATPQLPCIQRTDTGPCFGLCPRHHPAEWAEHMARHVAGESL